MSALTAVKITDKVYWVGAIDWEIRDFHGYAIEKGTTYNAYLILADKITLIDTVKEQFFDEMMERISSIIDPNKIDYIISNHSEMDHTGSLPKTIEAVNPEKVFASTMGVKALNDHFGLQNVLEVKDSSSLSLGSCQLKFMETKMLHWPDSMFTYLEEEGLLFCQDAFGMHLASTERFDDELPFALLEDEAKRYFANILMPYSALIKNLIKKVGESGLQIKMLAPDHGPVWRKGISNIIDLYSKWANKESKKKSVIVYDTMWKSTEKMSHAIADGAGSSGVDVKVMPLQGSHRSDVATEILDAKALIVGSPTLNGQVLPKIADVMCYLKGLKPKGLLGFAFGSFGWSGEAVKQLETLMKEMNVEIVSESLNLKYVPTDEDLEKCREMGKAIAEKI